MQRNGTEFEAALNGSELTLRDLNSTKMEWNHSTKKVLNSICDLSIYNDVPSSALTFQSEA